MNSIVTVVDYGLGNLHSVINGLNHIGATARVATNGSELRDAGHVVVPGVGAYADGMRGLTERGFVEALREHAQKQRPLIGICLGMQLLFESSEEFGHHAGLGIIPGTVQRIPSAAVKVPHVGWNRLLPPAGVSWAGSLLGDTPLGTWAYFVHSFHAVLAPGQAALAIAMHGPHALTAVVAHGTVTGFQYHPEKSGAAGLAMLRTYLQQKV